jgi:predicted RNA-binding Zn-ribbon protein involved in translation (DUF1610 family)
MNSEYETVIDCPNCGKEMSIEMGKAESFIDGLISNMFGDMGIKANSFKAARSCPSCGKQVVMVVTISTGGAE